MIVMAEDGVRIRVLQPGLGDPVLLIPDWLSSGMFFEALTPSLEARGLCPLRYDPRGSGRSDRPEYGYSLTRDAEDAALVAEAVVGQGVFVAGHGYGARVALRLSMLRPDLVRGLILMAPSVTGSRMETWHNAIEDERWLSDLLVTSMSRPIPPQDTAMLARDMAHTTRSAGLVRLRAMAEEVGALPASVAIGVVAGEFDGWTPIGMVRRTFQDRAGDRWRLMAASGHYLAWEDPDALAEAIEAMMHPAPPEPAVREDETGSVILVEPPPDDLEPADTANGLLEEEAEPVWPWEPESPGPEDAAAPDPPPSDGR